MSFENTFEDEFKRIKDERKLTAEELRIKTEIEGLAWRKWVDFYCRSCDEDFKLIGNKGYTSYKGGRWFYSAKCKCGKELIRRITDKDGDPYFVQSKRLRTDRRRYWKELLQRDDPRFRGVYGDDNLREEREKEEMQRTNFDNK